MKNKNMHENMESSTEAAWHMQFLLNVTIS
jgi:hypothetical protein